MTCHSCAARCRPHGHTRLGTRRYWCYQCRKTFSEPRRCVDGMYTPLDKINSAIQMLVEGSSLRSTSRMVDLELNTVYKLLQKVGHECDYLMSDRIRGVQVNHLELDEIWTFVKKKQSRVRPEDGGHVGDAYCFIALDRASRMVLAWHLGKRDERHTHLFVRKIRRATSESPFQISTDGFPAYELALERGLSDRASYGRLVKVNGPGRAEVVFGNANPAEIETTYVERFNGTLRQWCKRFTRRTYAFSKNWERLESALALLFAYYNFCKIHGTLHVTPAMQAGITNEPWTIGRLVEEACL